MTLSTDQAAGILGVASDAPWVEVRRAYLTHIGAHHPDRAGSASGGQAARINEAYRVLGRTRRPGAKTTRGRGREPVSGPEGAPLRPEPSWSAPAEGAPAVARLDEDTLVLGAPAEEAFRWLVDAAHDVGEVTYLDRSGPIMEVLCRFVGEPATSLVITLQGRADGTEAFCTTESIEARRGPDTTAVVDLLELALRRRQVQA
ncbi:hypothetical protein BH23ACT2_BH23ACT2_04900 [soil metagenome]